MLGWGKAVGALLSIISTIASYFKDRQLISAGEAKADAKGLRKANEATKRADDARRRVDHDADSVRDDRDNRD